MKHPMYMNPGKPPQYFISCGIVLATALVCYAFSDYISYHIAALLLVLAVSAIAMVYEVYPVLLSATLSALLLNFFFMPPLYTFHVNTHEDLLMLLIYFVIAVVNAVFTLRLKREERKTRERAERRNTLKLYTTLFNSLSHELKTPIATIIGATDTLRENHSLSEGNKEKLLAEISTAGLRLNTQVENLLNMGRLESGMLKINPDWCDVNELLYSMAREAKASTHSIEVVPNENLPLVKLDIGLIHQALYNLVKNAVAYTPAGSQIKLSGNHTGGMISISVEDNGPGLPEDSLLEIFDKFYRVPNTAAGGTGLGLSIVKGFVEAHGGTITAKNVPAGGALFTLLLPAEANYLNKLKNE
ncbi:sensor histidine kinase [Flavobacterium album]|uniref:histidine kinase n=1 Tax=Flavobacterium album TaxID=2175091 RepID=A0A2S1QVT8_9FLAO|nr:ATP-binding protein [Flavobacterium album]AWH84504.1 sensor histidine kinase [Flavobacterium album]